MKIEPNATLLLLSLVSLTDAFTTAKATVASHQRMTGKTMSLRSSLDDDDELSKLIGKRNEIKRKRKEEQTPKEEEDDLLLPDSIDVASMDFDKMPDFKTKRVQRVPKKKDKDEEEEKAKASVSKEPTYIDYYADHEDENEFHIPNRMGVSTKGWGDVSAGFVPSGKLKKQELKEGKYVPGDLQVAYNTLMNEGILLFETSPEYGSAMATKKLSAEDILCRCIKEYPEGDASPLLIGTYPNQLWQRGAKGLTDSLSKSCDRMEVSGVEVYQMKSLGWLPSGGLVKGMTEAVVDMGTVNYVGVKNVGPRRLRRMVSKFESVGIQLTTNSFDFSLTNRQNEKWITYCKTLGVIPLITDPLGGGLASGQYTASNPSGGVAGGTGKFPFAKLEKLQPLHSVLETVAERVKTRVTRDLRDLKERSRGRYGPEVGIHQH
jgi:aryl-alcohol dehydrogenase-like predicted oxidoreductase